MPSKNPKPSRQPAAEWRAQLARATEGLVPLKFQPLKVKLVRPEIQERMDSYRKIKSLMP